MQPGHLQHAQADIRDTEYKGHPCHASEDDPQYEMKSDKTNHIAMHKGSTLHRIV